MRSVKKNVSPQTQARGEATIQKERKRDKKKEKNAAFDPQNKSRVEFVVKPIPFPDYVLTGHSNIHPHPTIVIQVMFGF